MDSTVQETVQKILEHPDFSEERKAGLLDHLIEKYDGEEGNPDYSAELRTVKDCYVGGGTTEACLAGDTGPTGVVYPTSGSIVVRGSDGPTRSLKGKEEKGQPHVQAFFDQIADEGVRLTGDLSEDRKVIKEHWVKYKKDHAWEKGMYRAKQIMSRLFSISMDGIIVKSGLGFVIAGAVLGINLSILLSEEYPSDKFIPNLILGDEFNQDVGVVDFSDPLWGMLNQLYYNPLLDGFLDTLSDDKRPIAENVLVLVALAGLGNTTLIQNDLLDVSWAEQYQDEIRPMVEQLLRYLFGHADMGQVWQTHRYMPEINSKVLPGVNVWSGLTRGATATMLWMNSWNNARMYIKADVEQEIIGVTPLRDDDLNPFRGTSSALADGDKHKGFAMMMSDALIITDLIMQSALDLYKAVEESGNSVSPILKYLTPVAAFGLTSLVLGLSVSHNLANNPEKAFDPGNNGAEDYISDYIEEYKLNETPDDLGQTVNKAAGETYLAFLFGGLEALASSYSVNRKEIVDAFTLVNGMWGTNLPLAYTAAETQAGFRATGQGEEDQYGSLTATMNIMFALDFLASVYAGIEAGAVAAKGDKPFLSFEYGPAYVGLAIRLVFFVKALQSRAGPGRKALVLEQSGSLAAFVISALASWWFSPHRDHKFEVGLEFDSGRYYFSGKLAPLTNGTLGIATNGTFGASTQERPGFVDELKRNEVMLAENMKELEKIEASLAAAEAGDTLVDVAYLTKRREEIYLSSFLLEGEMMGTTSRQMAEQVAQLDEAFSMSGIFPYDPANEFHRELLARKLRPGLEVQKASLKEAIAEIEVSRMSFASTGFGPDHLTGIQIEYQPLSKEDKASLAQLRSELAEVKSQLESLETGHGLDRLYCEATGVDVRLTGMNSLLKDYRDSLDFQQQQLAELSTLLIEVAKG